jgi:hypothetical protein
LPRSPGISSEDSFDYDHGTYLPDFGNEEGGTHNQTKEDQPGSPDVSQHERH